MMVGLDSTLYIGLCQRWWATFFHFLSNRGRHLNPEAQMVGNSVEREVPHQSKGRAEVTPNTAGAEPAS